MKEERSGVQSPAASQRNNSNTSKSELMDKVIRRESKIDLTVRVHIRSLKKCNPTESDSCKSDII